jgi:uncharacterized protein
MDDSYRIANLAALENMYGPPAKFTRKESDHLHAAFCEFIEEAPFMVLATSGSSGLAASAKGDAGGFVRVLDEKTLLIPERGANGRNDSLRRIVRLRGCVDSGMQTKGNSRSLLLCMVTSLTLLWAGE